MNQKKKTSNHYDTLGLAKNANKEQIKGAYKKLALKWHPDKNPDNPQEAKLKFQEILQAYTVLSDQKKKDNYDQFGTDEPMDIDFDDFFTQFDSDTMMTMMMGDFESMFSSMFMGSQMRGGRGGRVRYPGKVPSGFLIKTNMPQKPKAKTEDEEWETEEEEDVEDDEGNEKVKGQEDEEWEDEDGDDNDDDETHVIQKGKNKNTKGSKNDDDDDDDHFQFESAFMMPLFMEENLKETDSKKFKCKIDNEVLKESNLMEHFSTNHKQDFQKWLTKGEKKYTKKGKQ